jgi:hypothetical protein
VLLASGPLNLNENGRFTVKVANDGMTDETSAMVSGIITFPDMSETTVTFFPPVSVESGSYKTAAVQKMMSQSGTVTIKAWTSLASDLDRSNDTITATFNVPLITTRELGWDDGVNDIATDAESGTTLIGFLSVVGTDVGNALGNYFFKTAGLQNIKLNRVKFFTKFNGTVIVTVIDNGIHDIPNGGDILYEHNFDVVSDSVNGSWVDIMLPTPVDLPDTTFHVFIGTAVDSIMPMIGIDVTTPVERLGFAIVGPDTIALNSTDPPFNSLDLMIRCMISGTSGIGDKPVEIPAELTLGDNYPNPFNPTTAILFGLPKSSRVELTVHNVLGKKIATLVDGNLTVGMHRAIWDGRDNTGRELPSGIYLYKLKADGKELSKKMILVK